RGDSVVVLTRAAPRETDATEGQSMAPDRCTSHQLVWWSGREPTSCQTRPTEKSPTATAQNAGRVNGECPRGAQPPKYCQPTPTSMMSTAPIRLTRKPMVMSRVNASFTWSGMVQPPSLSPASLPDAPRL